MVHNDPPPRGVNWIKLTGQNKLRCKKWLKKLRLEKWLKKSM